MGEWMDGLVSGWIIRWAGGWVGRGIVSFMVRFFFEYLNG